jgi:DNA-binding NtrC family response regulator
MGYSRLPHPGPFFRTVSILSIRDWFERASLSGTLKNVARDPERQSPIPNARETPASSGAISSIRLGDAAVITAKSADASHGFVGDSESINKIRRKIEAIGDSLSTVLLLGESGTGKEVLARALHNMNPRGAFVPIDCGSLGGPLMESELFGHVRGAFTGATDAKRGLIDLANGGTAFFDEIGDLPLDLQVKLLRLLQEREYRPLGSLNRHKVHIRVIAATHRDLAKAVKEGTFREDLYYRLNVISLRLPALRDRKEDIASLAESFLARHGDYEIPPVVLAALLDHDWPGNVRELQNCMDCMAAMNHGPILHIADLPPAVQYSQTRATTELSNLAAFASGQAVIPLHELERRAIANAIQFTSGDRATAAVLLGIGRTTLYRKMKEYRLKVDHSAPTA